MTYLARDNYKFTSFNPSDYAPLPTEIILGLLSGDTYTTLPLSNFAEERFNLRVEILNRISAFIFLRKNTNFDWVQLPISVTFYKKISTQISTSINVITYVFNTDYYPDYYTFISFWDMNGVILPTSSAFLYSDPTLTVEAKTVGQSYTPFIFPRINNLGCFYLIVKKSEITESNYANVLKKVIVNSQLTTDELLATSKFTNLKYKAINLNEINARLKTIRSNKVIVRNLKSLHFVEDSLFTLDTQRGKKLLVGTGYIKGKVFLKINGVNQPISTKVFLYSELTNQKIAETLSSQDGTYLFKGLSLFDEYFVLAKYPTKEFGYEVIPHKLAKEVAYNGLRVSYPTIE